MMPTDRMYRNIAIFTVNVMAYDLLASMHKVEYETRVAIRLMAHGCLYEIRCDLIGRSDGHRRAAFLNARALT